MPFITQEKTNWKFLFIVIVIALISGSTILWLGMRQDFYYETPPITITKKVLNETADSSSIASATEDWQTYRNEEYGFEVKYPQDWKKEEDRVSSRYFTSTRDNSSFEKEVVFISPYQWGTRIPQSGGGYEEGTLSREVSFSIYKDYTKYLDMCTKHQDAGCGEVNLLGKTYTIINGGTPVSMYVTVIIPKDNFFIVIKSISDISPWNTEEFNQMLSTFRFIK